MRTEKEVLDVFEKELASFETKGTGIRSFTTQILCYMPEYFLQKEGDKDNTIIIFTKSCLTIANKLFELECFRDKFQASERDCIRSALLLQDAMLYGTGEEQKRIHEHPEYVAVYIQNDNWEKLLPSFLRKEIAGMIASHEGQWNRPKEEDLKLPKPATECEIFVHMCSRLVKCPECTTQLPVVEQCYENLYHEMVHYKRQSAQISSEIKHIAETLVKGQKWDGTVREAQSGQYILLNGIRIPITGSLSIALENIAKTYPIKESFANPYGN